MSTDHQKYSTENQAEALQRYAAQRGMEIVRTYADEGKNGLRLDGRDSLKRLIDDVQSDKMDFTTILVEALDSKNNHEYCPERLTQRLSQPIFVPRTECLGIPQVGV